MANQLEVLVYQIDGNPLPEPTVISFLTSDIFIKESTISGTPEIQSALVYYSNASNLLQNQTFYVSETVDNLREAANANEITQIQATVLEIDGTPQIPLGVQYSFPATGISIWETIDGLMQVNSTIQFKNKKYGVSQSEATLIAAANAIVGNPNNPCYLEITSNGAFPYYTLAEYNGYVEHDNPFTALITVGNIQRLYGGSNINLVTIFANNVDVTSINDGCGVVTGFYDLAFNGCSSLTYVNFPSVGAITDSAFRQCSNLTIALFPKATAAYNNAFGGTTLISDISFPLLTELVGSVFQNMPELKTVSLPKLTSVPTTTFRNCFNLTTVDISSATLIDASAFENCTFLSSVIAPKTTSIGSYAFGVCSSLTTISFPLLETIYHHAFSGCTGLVNFIAPKVVSIGANAFESCGSLQTLSFPVLTTLQDQAFINCVGITTFTAPLLTSIGDDGFNGCTSLTTANFPLVTFVGMSAFSPCTALTIINFSSVTNLGGNPGYDAVFAGILGKTITLTVPVAMETIDGGDPDGDIVYLNSNNTVTINYI